MNHARWIMAGVAWLAGCAQAPARTASDRPVTTLKVRARIVQAPTPPASSTPSREHALLELCKLSVPGVWAEAMPLDGGMSVVVTTGDKTRIGELRQLAREMSGTNGTYRTEHAAAEPPREAPRDDEADPYAELEPPPIDVSVTALPVENGVVLIVAPRDKKESSLLAQRIRDDIDALTSGNCPTGDDTVG